MQSGLGSKKKAAWNIDIFNLKILKSNKELPWRKRANIRNYSMFEYFMTPSNSQVFVNHTQSLVVFEQEKFFAGQHCSLSLARMDPLILIAPFYRMVYGLETLCKDAICMYVCMYKQRYLKQIISIILLSHNMYVQIPSFLGSLWTHTYLR